MRTEQVIKSKVSNFFHSLLLFGGMILLFSLLGWFIAGSSGLILLLIFGVVLLLLSNRISAQIVLKAYRARPLMYHEAPQLLNIVEELSRRAGLFHPPSLYYIPSQVINAFSVGHRENAAIGVTDGILRNLNIRELTGVLAHEISHIRNNDLYVMGLADMINRTTSMLSTFGQILLFVNLPLILYGGHQISWFFILLLIFAPTISSLLQLGLSRSREYEADLEAARLTGDPRGLAAALAKLEQLEAGFLERIFLPGRRVPEPSLLRTHPRTEDRVKRLLELEEDFVEMARDESLLGDEIDFPSQVVRVPRWHIHGLWY
jgi:heat shock protein HtpX